MAGSELEPYQRPDNYAAAEGAHGAHPADDSHGVVSYGADSHGADSHGAVEVAHAGALVSYNPDAPSEEWGWHGHWSDFAPRGRRALLWLGVFGLLLMTWGNQQSHVEDYFLVLCALIMAAWIVRGERERKRQRRIKP